MARQVELGRLAFRVEGNFWNAYWAEKQNSMENAVLLGSIRMVHVQRLDRKNQFMELMRDVFSDLVEEKMGARPSWDGERVAPPHERAGNA